MYFECVLLFVVLQWTVGFRLVHKPAYLPVYSALLRPRLLGELSRVPALRANPRRIEFGDGQNHAQEMVKHTLLTAQDEVRLAQDYKAGAHIVEQFKELTEKLGRPVTEAEVAETVGMEVPLIIEQLKRMEEAKEALTAANMRLVFHIARYYKFRGVAYPDLVQEGTFGLIKAIQKFDPDRGFRFSTYASWWIKQAVSRAIAEKSRLVRLPVHIHDMMVSISKVDREFVMEHGRKPSPQEVAARLGLPLAKVELLLRASQDVTSIDESAYQNRGKMESSAVTVQEKVASTTNADPAALCAKNGLRAELRQAMSILNEREAEVLELRFGLSGGVPMTLEDIGKQFNVTRERIRQIEARALSKMRHPAKKSELEDIFNEHCGLVGAGARRGSGIGSGCEGGVGSAGGGEGNRSSYRSGARSPPVPPGTPFSESGLAVGATARLSGSVEKTGEEVISQDGVAVAEEEAVVRAGAAIGRGGGVRKRARTTKTAAVTTAGS